MERWVYYGASSYIAESEVFMEGKELIALIHGDTSDRELLWKLDETEVVSWEEIRDIIEALRVRRPGMYIRVNRQVQTTWRNITQMLQQR
jgi:hypothetical protein